MKDKKKETALSKKDETSLTNVNYQRDRLFKKGINLMADEKLDEAVINFEMILRADPNDVEAMLKLGYSRFHLDDHSDCLLYTSPSPRDATLSRMPSSA